MWITRWEVSYMLNWRWWMIGLYWYAAGRNNLPTYGLAFGPFTIFVQKTQAHI